MNSGKMYEIAKMDKKGRLHIPKAIRNSLELEDEVIMEREDDLLVIKPIRKIENPIEFLASINVKTKKSPVEMKRESENVFGG